MVQHKIRSGCESPSFHPLQA